ncbi:MAG: SAM-dependent methyltransferase [Deltaproteobacteria bacterium]|nr:MAG: SAM-dependent methyltransferase [Deltaproteobacteria bacterium]
MRDETPSTTAMAVAWFRGLGSLPGRTPPVVHDPFAAVLLPAVPAAVLRAAEQAAPRAPWLRSALQAVSTPLARHVALRTATIDGAVEEAIADGARQLVIVGAGLDARAWRLPLARDIDAWEVDHPATQAFKRERTGQLLGRTTPVHFTAVDFERETLAGPLERAGHDATVPTVWIWEGVTMYLHPDATRGTLEAIAERSAPGSRLAMTYAWPGYARMPAWLDRPVQAAFDLLGESLRGAMTREEGTALLEATGFRVLDEHGNREWATRFGEGAPAVEILERLFIAERAG